MSLFPVEIDNQKLQMLDLIKEIFSRYCLIGLFIFGTVGLILNTLIFTRHTFRQNSCVLYFLASTIANYFVVFFVLPSRILSDGFNIDPGQYNAFYCKIRFYTYFTAKSLSSWFIVLACLDRKMSSSQNAHRRAFARPNIARWMIFLTTLIGLIFYSHVLIFYDIDRNQQCNARSGFYSLFNDGVYLVGYSLTPPLLMLLLGLWTILSTRRHRRIVPRFGRRMSSINHHDNTLMLMLLLQVTLVSITAVPHAVQKLYSTITINVPKDDLAKAGENVFITVVRTVSFFNHACTFYLLTLSGRTFRKELYKILKKMICKTRHEEINTNVQLRTLTQTVNINRTTHHSKIQLH